MKEISITVYKQIFLAVKDENLFDFINFSNEYYERGLSKQWF